MKCSLGVGCEDAGVCYASAMGDSSKCGKMTDTRDSFEYAGDLHISKSDYGQISDFRFNRLSGLGAGVYRLFTATPPVVDFDADDVDELKDYRELHAAIVGNQPIWPNGWCQNVAAVAFVINNERQAALQAGAGDAQVVPVGWTLVPIEPNWDMRNEGREFLIEGVEKEPEKLAYFLWKTMVAASPKELEKRDAAIDNAQATEGK